MRFRLLSSACDLEQLTISWSHCVPTSCWIFGPTCGEEDGRYSTSWICSYILSFASYLCDATWMVIISHFCCLILQLGLSEKEVFNHDFELALSDPSDANTNSTTLLSDDTDDKLKGNSNQETGASNHREYEASLGFPWNHLPFCLVHKSYISDTYLTKDWKTLQIFFLITRLVLDFSMHLA